jgi:hypothetical protein
MSFLSIVGQLLASVPFVVFAYWYHQEEELYRSALPETARKRTMFGHGLYGLFFGVTFAILGVLFFLPITQTAILVACTFIIMRAFDNLEYDKVALAGVRRQ